jgi:radical SAM protein with 4Fe4S-binding SPASM domain
MSLVDLLQEVEIDPIDICNRSCVFCPRSQNYPNTKRRLDSATSLKINESLLEIDYKNAVSFCGFGEPLLHKELETHIKLVTQGLSLTQLFIVTNGDYLTSERLKSLEDVGITQVKVSLYDSDTSEQFLSKNSTSIKLTFRHYYQRPDFEVMRNEIYHKKHSLNISRPCYLPFTSTLIDFDGNILLCANDWTKHNCFGNVHSTTLAQAWSSSALNGYRDMLAQGRRQSFPCSACDVNGCLSGQAQFDTYRSLHD